MARIHNVHAREIAAPAEVAGEILDTLGSSGDRVWASEIWVAEPVVFDRPLGVGADGGHGPIRYSVIEYEPGRRIVFEFSPGGGLSGTHRFELEATGSLEQRTRISRWLRIVNGAEIAIGRALGKLPPAPERHSAGVAA